jgi:hypothetical protein
LNPSEGTNRFDTLFVFVELLHRHRYAWLAGGLVHVETQSAAYVSRHEPRFTFVKGHRFVPFFYALCPEKVPETGITLEKLLMITVDKSQTQ